MVGESNNTMLTRFESGFYSGVELYEEFQAFSIYKISNDEEKEL